MFGNDHKVKRLRDVTFLADCSLNDVRLVASRGDLVRVRAGEVVTDASQRDKQFVVVLSGEARLEDGSRLGAGDSYGAVALLDDSASPASLTMTRDGDVLVFGRREFASLLRRVPGFGAGLARHLVALLAR